MPCVHQSHVDTAWSLQMESLGWMGSAAGCASAPCEAAHPRRGRQPVRVVMGLKSQLDNFITINIICSYAGRGYDTNN